METIEKRVARGERWVFAMRSALQSVSASENFQQCGKPWKKWVGIKVAPGGAEIRADGIHSCRSAWLCPVCWRTRRTQERGEIEYACEMWTGGGGGIVSTAITVPHHLGEPLVDVWSRVDAWSLALRSGQARVAMRRDFGVERIIRAVEMTYGANGWHPHEHWLLFANEPMDEATRAGLWRWIRERHKRHKPHRRTPTKPELWPTPYRPQDVRTVDPANHGAVANHITKGASATTEERYYKAVENGQDELARYLAPFLFGEQAALGDPQALSLWREYEEATFGRQWIRWSNGFRSDLALPPAGRWPAMDGEVAQYVPAGKWNDAYRDAIRGGFGLS